MAELGQINVFCPEPDRLLPPDDALKPPFVELLLVGMVLNVMLEPGVHCTTASPVPEGLLTIVAPLDDNTKVPEPPTFSMVTLILVYVFVQEYAPAKDCLGIKIVPNMTTTPKNVTVFRHVFIHKFPKKSAISTLSPRDLPSSYMNKGRKFMMPTASKIFQKTENKSQHVHYLVTSGGKLHNLDWVFIHIQLKKTRQTARFLLHDSSTGGVKC